MTLYDTLDISPDASKKDIEKAYRAKAMKMHPDKGGDKTEFQALTLAYSTLKDPDRRAHYDRTGDTDSPKSKQDQIFRMLLIEGFTRSDKPIKVILQKLDSDCRKAELQREEFKKKRKVLQIRLDKFLKLNDNSIVKETIESCIAGLDRNISEVTEALDMLTRLKNDFKEFKEEQDNQMRETRYPNMEEQMNEFVATFFREGPT